jgi:hypothetical protein
MSTQGVVFHFGESPTAIEKNSDRSLTLVTTNGSERADTVMFATGRAPNTKVTCPPTPHTQTCHAIIFSVLHIKEFNPSWDDAVVHTWSMSLTACCFPSDNGGRGLCFELSFGCHCLKNEPYILYVHFFAYQNELGLWWDM